MRFRLRDLPEQRAFSLSEDFVRDALGAVAGQTSLDDDVKPGAIDVRVEVVEEQEQTVFARGALSGWIHVACSRCLGPVKLDVSEDFALTFLPKEQAPADDDEVELDEDDLDVAAHDGVQVDLTPILRDHVVLSVPYAPLCAEDCKGLCSQCGADLNEGACACKPVEVEESPWAALKNIKLDN